MVWLGTDKKAQFKGPYEILLSRQESTFNHWDLRISKNGQNIPKVKVALRIYPSGHFLFALPGMKDNLKEHPEVQDWLVDAIKDKTLTVARAKDKTGFETPFECSGILLCNREKVLFNGNN